MLSIPNFVLPLPSENALNWITATKIMEFLQSIREKIKRSQRYPRAVRNLADSSETQVKFTIRSDGSLTDAKVVASSGSKSFDAAALSAVRDAAPFPSFPEGQEGSTLRLEIPIAFQLKTN